MITSKKKKPTWTDLKRNLVDLEQNALLGLVQDLYAASKENKAFLHARFGLGDDVLEPYKATISRWICPDVMRNQDISVSKAKKAISDYRKAVGHPVGMTELSVFYCESCTNFLSDYGMVRMFEQALKSIKQLNPEQQEDCLGRLDEVQYEAKNWGYGVSEDMNNLMAEYGFNEK